MDTARLAAQRQSVPFFDWYANSPHQLVTPGDGMMDLLFGNPQDMPIPAYVDALRRHLEPEDPGWFAYKLNEPGATTAAAEGLRRHTGLLWEAQDVAITNGGWAAIGVAIRMLTEPGDEVVYFDPPWFFYDVTIRAADAVPVAITLEPPRFSPDPQRLAEAITPRTRAVLMNSPHNPTGRVLLAAELEAVAEVLRDASARYGRPIYLLSDEAYRRIVFDGAPRGESRRALRLDDRPVLLRQAAPRTGSAHRLPGPLTTHRRGGAGDPARGGAADTAGQQLLVRECAPAACPARYRRPVHRHRRAPASA